MGFPPKPSSHASSSGIRQSPCGALPKHPRLRASCDGCFVAKIKCSKARPMCSRCLQTGLICHYSPSSRASNALNQTHSSRNKRGGRAAAATGGAARRTMRKNGTTVLVSTMTDESCEWLARNPSVFVPVNSPAEVFGGMNTTAWNGLAPTSPDLLASCGHMSCWCWPGQLQEQQQQQQQQQEQQEQQYLPHVPQQADFPTECMIYDEMYDEMYGSGEEWLVLKENCHDPLSPTLAPEDNSDVAGTLYSELVVDSRT